MKHQALGHPIETKLQVTELTLLPPNSKGIMPAGVQRFPFEFPIPATLPTSVYIRDRMEIFYQLSATIRRSTSMGDHESISPINWIDWARRNSSKKKHVACSPIRIVRAIESIVCSGLPNSVHEQQQQQLNIQQTGASPASDAVSSSNSLTVTPSTEELVQLPWNRRSLSEYQGTLDEQHDQLAYSLSGRTTNNLNHSPEMMENVCGIRYKIGFDRTAIAIGTSVGIELMLEPTSSQVVVDSVVMKISENRKYAMKVPSDHTWSADAPETKRVTEGVKMILKWAYGYEVENNDSSFYGEQKKDSNRKKIHESGANFVYQRSCSSHNLAYFDPPQPGSTSSKSFLGSQIDSKPRVILDSEEQVLENDYQFASSSSSPISTTCDREMINLKELNQTVNVGEYFGGRFVLPVPDCSNILNPSMEYESININHWIQLVVTIRCEGKKFDLLLESPGRVLDCRVVSVDDDCQTILPPPPSYQPGDGHLYQENTWSTGTFWEQREAITSVSGWGSCVPCPCQYKKLKKSTVKGNSTCSSVSSELKKASAKRSSTGNTKDSCPPSLMPEWGPPPCYSEN